MRKVWTIFGVLCILALLITGFLQLIGTGSFKRMVTLSGVYSVCKPDHYPVVCFLDADGRDGGMFCMPLSAIGGDCNPSK